jgi:hypothetical protein
MSNFSNRNMSDQLDRDRIDLSEAGIAEVERAQELKSLSRASEQKILRTLPRVASEASAEFSRPLTGHLSKLFSGGEGYSPPPWLIPTQSLLVATT